MTSPSAARDVHEQVRLVVADVDGTLVISNTNGSVKIQTWDRNEIRITGEKRAKTAEELALHEDGDLILVHIEGSHFIWKMVRRIVGVLVAVGKGELSEAEAESLLTSASDLPARLTAPASGLFLERVYYEGDPRDHELTAASVVPRIE